MESLELFTIEDTPYGGRGAFSSQVLPKSTLLHICPAPYASVIYQKFRKEICANCFAYAFTANRNTWNIKSELPGDGGVSFCSIACRDLWVKEQNIDGLLGLVGAAIDKVTKTMLKRGKDECGPYKASNIAPTLIDDAMIDLAWTTAENNCISSKDKDVIHLDAMELDIARFTVSAILKRYQEDKATGSDEQHTWDTFLTLQNNELTAIRARPEMLNSHLRVYGVLRRAFALIPIPLLQTYVSSSETVRAICGRDQGNAFGVWEDDWVDVNAAKSDPETEYKPDEESEMFGWGMYVSGSFFNHDCTPNVRKLRVGRAYHFFTAREVQPGEELCISYVGVSSTDTVNARRAELFANWYFECQCARCMRETVLLSCK